MNDAPMNNYAAYLEVYALAGAIWVLGIFAALAFMVGAARGDDDV